MLAAFAMAAILVVGVGVLQFGAVVSARHRAQSAADLGALAAAGALLDGEAAACAAAAEIAVRMDVAVGDCVVEGWDAVLTVTARVDLALLGVRDVRASARAGPVDESG